MSKCLVTGGAGFIGGHLVEALIAGGHDVRVIDDYSTSDRSAGARWDGVEVVAGSICDETALLRALDGVEVIFHQAALASVPRSVDRPQDTHFACATGTLLLLDAARKSGVRRIIYAASSSAYGNSSWSSKREQDMPDPLSPYAAAKLAGEMYCKAFFQTYGLETVCLRYFNVFGPRQNPHGAYAAVIPRFITRMLSGERPVIYGDGGQSRDFTYVENVVSANLLAAQAPRAAAGKVYNVATGRSVSLLNLVTALNRILKTDLTPECRPERVGDVRDSLADIAMARRDLNYEPCVDFEEGLRRTVAHYSQKR